MPDLPKEVTIGFGPTGIHILDSEAFLRDGATKDCALISYGYADLYRWGGSASKFSVIIWSSAKETTFEFGMSTSQAAAMAAIVSDYIEAIMATTEYKEANPE
mmetsp:Transcript_46143/g.128229  ORF Transcript_46143/g.128229 Transcript_46143/m.128229 type:complete len:103 (+) Transcript_46143:2785-3093(+)